MIFVVKVLLKIFMRNIHKKMSLQFRPLVAAHILSIVCIHYPTTTMAENLCPPDKSSHKVLSMDVKKIITKTNSKPGLKKFFCQCKAKAPGYEETNAHTGKIDKICSYGCKCIAWEIVKDKQGNDQAKGAISDILLDANKLATSALSRESWDHGSHICHGQYSYKPRLNDPNWKIQVKFDTFSLNEEGKIFYPEDSSRLIAQGINYVGFKYSLEAPEIANAISAKLMKK